MGKRSAVHTHNDSVFSLGEEGKPAISYNAYESWGHDAKWNKPEDKGCVILLMWGT